MPETRKGGKKNRKIGRAARKPKTAKYKANHQREKNKLKRVLQSCGENEAFRYAQKNGVINHFNKLMNKRGERA